MNARSAVRRILILAAIPVFLFLGATLVGTLLPEEHIVANECLYLASAETLWLTITDFDRYSDWRDRVNDVEELPDRNGNEVWREVGPQGAITYELVEWEPPRRMTSRIADPDLPFGGTWSWSVEALDRGARVTLVERGEIRHPLFRFMARYLIGHHSAIDDFQRELARELGETVTPIHISPPES